MAGLRTTMSTEPRALSMAPTRPTLVAIGILLGIVGCTVGTATDGEDEAASLLQVQIPSSAMDRSFSIDSGRDGTFVHLEYAIPVNNWRSYLNAYPNLEISLVNAGCRDWCSHFGHPLPGESHFFATDRITIDDNGDHEYQRSVRVVPDATSGKAWILWANDRPPGL